MQKYFNTILDQKGDPIQEADVLVQTSAGATATIYSDNSGTTTGNPIETDENGYFEFYAPNGLYTVVASKTGKTTVTISNVLLDDPTVATIAALKAAGVPTTANARITVLGYTSAGDGGGGDFYWVTGDQSANVTADPQSGIWVAPTSASTGASGAWKRLYSGSVYGEWFGMVGDYNYTTGTDNTTAFQAVINFLSNHDQTTALLGDGIFYCAGNVYAHYDATNNPNFNSGSLLGGRITIRGQGQMQRRDYANDTYVGSTIRFATNKGLILGNGGTQKTWGQKWERLNIVGSTSGTLVDANYVPQFSLFDNLFIANDDRSGTGKAFYVRDTWMSQISNVEIIGRKDLVAGGFGEGFVFEDTVGGGDNLFWNITAAYFGAAALRFGKPYNAANAIARAQMIVNCQGQYSTEGLLIQHGIAQTRVINYWGEGNTTSDLRIDNSAEHIKIEGGNLTSTSGLTANAILGNNSGTATTDAAAFIEFEGTRFFCQSAGVRKYGDAVDVKFTRCAVNNGGACFLSVDVDEGGEIILEENDYYPLGASSEISQTRRICYVTAGPTYTDYSNRARRLDYADPTISANLDMSAWRYPAEEIRVNTASGSVNVLLPTSLSGARLVRCRVKKVATANNVVIDAGAGNTIEGTQTKTLTAPYSVAQVQHAGSGSTVWDIIGDAVADFSGSATWDPGNLVDGAGETSASITVTGAALGDFAIASAPYDLQGITCNAYVDAANSVKIRLQNETGGAIDLASGTWRVRVIKQ